MKINTKKYAITQTFFAPVNTAKLVLPDEIITLEKQFGFFSKMKITHSLRIFQKSTNTKNDVTISIIEQSID